MELVASELATNAVVHGRGAITLVTSVAAGVARIEVTDEGHGNAAAIREQQQENDFGGWGLRLVEEVAERWGAYEGTTHVWRAEFSASSR